MASTPLSACGSEVRVKSILLLVLGLLLAGVVSSSSWGRAPKGQYAISGDLLVDRKSGLVWQRGHSSVVVDHATATAYCQGLVLGGYSSGWRVPSKFELESVVDFSMGNPAIDELAFPSTPINGYFWTSTPYYNAAGQAFWYVNFGAGNSGYGMDTCWVRCVR